MKDTGHVAENWQWYLKLFRGFHRFSINIRIEVHFFRLHWEMKRHWSCVNLWEAQDLHVTSVLSFPNANEKKAWFMNHEFEFHIDIFAKSISHLLADFLEGLDKCFGSLSHSPSVCGGFDVSAWKKTLNFDHNSKTMCGRACVILLIIISGCYHSFWPVPLTLNFDLHLYFWKTLTCPL